MRKFLAILLALIFVLSTVLLVACDDKPGNGGDAETSDTEGDGTSETTGSTGGNGGGQKDPNGPGVEVQSVGGKNAATLFNDAIAAVKSATVYEFVASIQSTGYSSTISVKKSRNTVYGTETTLRGDTTSYQEMWGLSDWCYWNCKYADEPTEYEKKTSASAYEMVMNSLTKYKDSLVMIAESDLVKGKIPTAKLYQNGDIYYIDIAFTAAEGGSMTNNQAGNFKFTFNANGALTSLVCTAVDGTTATYAISNIGNVAEISAPANVHLYVDTTDE